jgi:hypothetical protein
MNRHRGFRIKNTKGLGAHLGCFLGFWVAYAPFLKNFFTLGSSFPVFLLLFGKYKHCHAKISTAVNMLPREKMIGGLQGGSLHMG